MRCAYSSGKGYSGMDPAWIWPSVYGVSIQVTTPHPYKKQQRNRKSTYTLSLFVSRTFVTHEGRLSLLFSCASLFTLNLPSCLLRHRCEVWVQMLTNDPCNIALSGAMVTITFCRLQYTLFTWLCLFALARWSFRWFYLFSTPAEAVMAALSFPIACTNDRDSVNRSSSSGNSIATTR